MEGQRNWVALPMAHNLEAAEPGFRLSSGWNKRVGYCLKEISYKIKY